MADQQDPRRQAAIQRRIQEQLQSLQPENEQGYFGDSVDAFQHGLISGGADLADGVRYLTGSETAGNIADSLRGSAQDQLDQMSPAGREAMQSFGINTDGGLGFNEGSTVGGFGLNVISGLGSFAPTMIPGGLAARGLSAVGKVAGAAGKAGKAVDKAADVIGFGGAGALTIGGGTGNQAYETVAKADFNVLKDAEIFKQRYWEMRDFQEMGHEEALTAARESIATEIAEEAAKDGATLGAISQGALGPAFGRLFRGEVGGYAKSIAHGAATEGTQELIESGGQRAVTNVNVNPAIPTETMDGVVGDALTGAMTGAAVGGAFGAGGRLANRNRQQPEPEDTLPGEQTETTARADALQAEIDQLDDQIQNNSDELSDAEYSALLQRREALLREQLGESNEPTQTIETDSQPFDMAGPEQAQAQQFGLSPNGPVQDKTEYTRNQSAFERQNGTARNTSLDGEYIPNQQPETNYSWENRLGRIGETVDGVLLRDPQQVGRDEQQAQQARPQERLTGPRGLGLTPPNYLQAEPERAQANKEAVSYSQINSDDAFLDAPSLRPEQRQQQEGRQRRTNQRTEFSTPQQSVIAEPYQPTETELAARETTRRSFEEPVTDARQSRKARDEAYQLQKQQQAQIEQSRRERQQQEAQKRQRENQVALGQLEVGSEVKAAKGAKAKAYTPSNKAIDVEYQIVEASDLTTSHDDNFQARADYPQALQNRDRSSPALRKQVEDNAKNLIPEKLGEDSGVVSGAPIIRNGVVESGNGRTMSIRRAYNENGAANYRQYLENNAERLGISKEALSQFNQPVLVRQRLNDMTADELTSYTKDANTTDAFALNPVEQAKSDSNRLSDDDMALIDIPESGDFAAASNRSFVRKFLSRFPKAEQNAMLNGDGTISDGGINRVQNAIFAKAYGSDQLIEDITSTSADDMKTVAKALINAAPEVAKLNAQGGVDGFTDTIVDAVNIVKRSRRDDVPVKELTDQFDLMSENTVDPTTASLANYLDQNVRSIKRMTDAIKGAAQRGQDGLRNSQTDGLFGRAPAPTTANILNIGGESSARSGKQNSDTGKQSSDISEQNTDTGKQTIKLAASGKPFATEKSARLSRTFSSTANAEVVPVEGGYGVRESNGESSPTFNPSQYRNYGWDRVKLSKNYTGDQLKQWIDALKADPDNLNESGGIYIYDKKTNKKLDALSWAITYQIQQGRESDTKTQAEEETETQAKIEAETAAKKDSLSNIIDSYSDETLTDDDAIPKSYTGPAYAFFNDVRSRMDDGDKVTIEEIREGFERLASDPEKSKAELNKLNKKQLMGFVTHAYSDTKKAKLVNMAFTSSVKDYRFIGNTKGVITSSSYDEAGIIKEGRDHLASLTQNQVDDYAQFRRGQIAERATQIEERRQRIDNPETLEDYQDAIRVKGRDGLTDQQLAEYDRLVAEKDMADKPEVKAGLEQEEKVELGEPEESTHGKTGETIFNVKVITKLGKDKFKEAAAFARSMGGGYYRGNFYLKTREDAEVFSGWVNGEDVDLTQSKQEAKAEKKAKSADKLKAMADRLEKQAMEALNTDRKENTFKRMNEADSARKRANQDIKTAAMMKAIADNDQSVLKGLTQKTQIELLQQLTRSLEYYAPKELKHTTPNGNSVFNDDVASETKAKYAKMPLIDARPVLLEDIAKRMMETKGYVLAGKSIRSKTDSADRNDTINMNQQELAALRKYIDNHQEELKYNFAKGANADLKRLERMGIKSRASLRAALVEFMQIENSLSNVSEAQSKLGRMERDLQRTIVGNRNSFNDFFPTPTETAIEIIDLADIQPGMKVLEPSAGNGLLADAAKEAGAKVDAVEMAGQLREILNEKGYKLVGDDFLEYSGGIGEYDRIVMNPPFSSDQDIQHVAHAYDKLKPGGRLVAIVSSMAGERQNKRNQAFNQWLDDLGAETQPLPENAFKSSLNPTAVRTKAIIIDKPEDGSVNVPDEVRPPKEALMSLNQGEASGMSADDVRAAVEPLINDLHERGTFEVVQSINDLPFAIRLQAKVKLKQSKGENPVLRGINAGDKNYLIADGLRSEKEAVEIFLHEVVGHKAVLDMLGKDGNNIMEQIARSYGRQGLADLIKTYGVEPNTKEGRILLGKEKVAHMAERGEKPALLKRLVAKVKAWLRNYFPSIKWSDNDVLSLISNARDNVENRYMTKVDLDADTQTTTQEDSINLSIRGDDNPKDVNDIIGRTQAKPEHQKGLMERAADRLKAFKEIDTTAMKQAFIDSYAAIESLEKKVNFGKLMDGAESAYKAALRTANLDSQVEAVMRRGALKYENGAFQIKEGTKGFLEIFQKIADSNQLQLWETWAGAKRAKRIMEEDARANLDGQAALKEHRATINQLKKITPAKYPGGLTQWRKDMRAAENGMKEARTRAFQKRERLYKPSDIQRVIKYVNDNPELKKEFEQAQSDWRKFNKSMLDMAEQAGLIDPEARAIWEHDDYVPFHRVAEIEADGGISQYATKRGLSGQKSGIKQLKGGVEKLNIIESMVRNVIHLVDASNKNVAMQRVVDLADGVAMEKLPTSKIDPEERDMMLREFGYEPESMDQDTLNAWANQLERYNSIDKGVVSVSRNGKLHKYHVTDTGLFAAITQLGPMRVDGMLKVLGIPKRVLTASVTAAPGFMSANFVRDTLSTWVTVEPKTTPVYDAIKGAAKGLQRSETQWAIMAAGAGGGGYYDTSPDSVRQHLSPLNKGGALHKPKQLWDAWMRVGQALENANRIAVYDSVIRDGGTVAEAAHQAQDVINFSKRGAHKWVQGAITLMPFLNARIQGLERLYRGAKENPKAFFMKGAILMGASLALLASNWDNEEYWELDEWDRDANWHIFAGGEHFKIPKPFEVGAFFGTVPERVFEQLRSDASGKLLAERMLAMITGTFAFNPFGAQVIKPGIDVMQNKNGFTGNPILGFGDQFRSPEGQYSPWTSETMKQLAEAMPDSAPEWMRSPKRLEYLFKGYFGTLGGYALSLTDMATQEIVGAPDQPDTTLGRYPVVKRFYSDELTGNKHVGRFYDMAEEVNAIYSDVKTRFDDGQSEQATKLMDKNLDKLRLRSHLNKVRQQMSDISSQIRMIYMDTKMSSTEKRRRIDELTKRRNQIARTASLQFYGVFN